VGLPQHWLQLPKALVVTPEETPTVAAVMVGFPGPVFVLGSFRLLRDFQGAWHFRGLGGARFVVRGWLWRWGETRPTGLPGSTLGGLDGAGNS